MLDARSSYRLVLPPDRPLLPMLVRRMDTYLCTRGYVSHGLLKPGYIFAGLSGCQVKRSERSQIEYGKADYFRPYVP